MFKLHIYKKTNQVTKDLILLLIASVGIISCQHNNETYIVEEHDISEAVYASGEILPCEYYFAKSSIIAPIHRIIVKEGDKVVKGDALAVIGNSYESDKIQFATEQVAIAKNNLSDQSAILSEIKQNIKFAELRFETDKNNAQKYMELAKEQAVSKNIAEEKKLLEDKSLTILNTLKEQYTSTISKLNSQLLEAEYQLANVLQEHSKSIVRSSISGKVYSILKKTGEMTNPESPILLVGSENRYKLELLVDERDIDKVQIGQKVYFESNTKQGKIYEANVDKIYPILIDESRSFKIDAIITDSASFFPKSTIEASIIIRKNAPALLIPFDFIINNDRVLLNTHKIVNVKTGIRINNMIEISNGISKGDTIIKSPINETIR